MSNFDMIGYVSHHSCMIRRYSIIYEPQLDFSFVLCQYSYSERVINVHKIGMLLDAIAKTN